MRTLILLTTMIAACASMCATPRILTPPVGPNTEYPCGVHGLQCANQLCCDESDVCGGGPWSGCPAGYCCFVGLSSNEGLAGYHGSARHPQRAPRAVD